MRFNTEKMQERMNDLELTQSDLARIMGLSRQHIHQYLVGGQIKKFQTIEKLAKVLKTKEFDLIIED